jgi:hypothetical protein
MQGTSYTTRGGIRIQRETWIGPYEREHDTLAHTLDDRAASSSRRALSFPAAIRGSTWALSIRRWYSPRAIAASRSRRSMLAAGS